LLIWLLTDNESATLDQKEPTEHQSKLIVIQKIPAYVLVSSGSLLVCFDVRYRFFGHW